MSNSPQSGNYNAQQFSNNVDINNFFKQFNADSYVDWFNKNIAKTQYWAKGIAGGKGPVPLSKQSNWEIVWANLPIIFGRQSVNLVEFLCIVSIMINETGGTFAPVSESVGSSGNPGISYAFNSISGIKSSYNTLNTNWTAYKLFNDPIYINVHGTKPMGSILKKTNDSRWSGNLFPLGFSGKVENETDKFGKTNGFIYESDFIKFRGRGYIQTTGRANYKPLISYVINYTGNDSTILSMKKAWSSYNGNLDSIASASTNAQWDTLFNGPNFIIANYAVRVHSDIGNNYNVIDPNQSMVNLQKSIRNVALKIAGGNAKVYADVFLQRVLAQLNLINSYSNPNTSIPIPTVQTPDNSSNPGRLETTGQDPNSQVNGDNITGSSPSLTNVFKPTVKPGPITF